MDVTFRQLRVFCEVARQENMSRAAEVLFVTQPTISAVLKDLERQVDEPLFERRGRRLQLTAAGRVLREYADRALHELAAAERALADLHGGETGRLLLGASSTPGTYLLPPLLAEFRRRLPGVELSLEVSDTREAIDRVMSGRLDLAVVGEAYFPGEMCVETFLRDTLVLIVAPTHPLARKEHVHLADLAGEPFVLREVGSSTREILERKLRARGFTPRQGMELGSAEAVKKVVAASHAVSFISEHAVSLEVQVGVLVARQVTDLEIHRQLNIIWRNSFKMTRLYEQFLAVLRVWEAEPLSQREG